MRRVGNIQCKSGGVSGYWTRYYVVMSMMILWTLGELLAKARKDAGFDQSQLAAAVGIARNSLSNYETGRSVPPFDVAARIASACGVSLEWLATAVNTEVPAASATGTSSLSQHSARLEGLEPPTF